jgi:hypothetical protein
MNARNGRRFPAFENDADRAFLVDDERRFLAFDQHGLEHAADAEVAAIDQAQPGERLHQLRVPRQRWVVKDVGRRDAADQAAWVGDFQPRGIA